MYAKDIIDTTIQPITYKDNCLTVLSWMEDLKLMHIPVVDDGDFCGLISEAEIYSLDNPDVLVSEVKDKLKLVAIKETHYIHNVVKMFVVRKLSLLPVLDVEGKYIGSITQNSLINALGDIISAKVAGATIIFEMNNNDFVLSQIANICEENDVRILNVFTLLHEDSTKMDVIIKVNTDDVDAIIRTFERYEYSIKATFLKKDNRDDEMRDRYEYIMNYLNI